MGMSTMWDMGKPVSRMMGVAFPAARHMPVARSAHSATFFGSDFAKARKSASIMVFMGRSFSVR